jgi:hypothetical protein
MNEWQPGRIHFVHLLHDFVPLEGTMPLSEEEKQEIDRKLWMVRPTVPPKCVLNHYRAIGCDASRFFELNDAEGSIVCEHELFTD